MTSVEIIERIETALTEIENDFFKANGIEIESCDCDISWEQVISWDYAVSELARIMVEVAEQNR